MKIITIFSVLFLMSILNAASQEVIQKDFKKGTYHKIKIQGIKERWKSQSTDYDIQIKTKVTKKTIKNNTLNFQSDAFILDVQKFTVDGVSYSESFKQPIEILTFYTSDDKTYIGNYVDPISNQQIMIFLTFIPENKIELYFKIGETKRVTQLPLLKKFVLYQKNGLN